MLIAYRRWKYRAKWLILMQMEPLRIGLHALPCSRKVTRMVMAWCTATLFIRMLHGSKRSLCSYITMRASGQRLRFNGRVRWPISNRTMGSKVLTIFVSLAESWSDGDCASISSIRRASSWMTRYSITRMNIRYSSPWVRWMTRETRMKWWIAEVRGSLRRISLATGRRAER